MKNVFTLLLFLSLITSSSYRLTDKQPDLTIVLQVTIDGLGADMLGATLF